MKGLLQREHKKWGSAEYNLRATGQQNADPQLSALQSLRPLLLEDDLRLLRSQLLFAVGAGHVAQGYGIGHRAELPQRTLASSIGICRRRAAYQRLLGSHFMYGSMLRMLGKLKDLRLVRQYPTTDLSPG